MADEPSETGDNGRDERGRFTTGNQAARGNPYARRVAAFRSALYEALTPEEVKELVRKLFNQAMGGDAAAARIILDRLYGPPVALDIEERMHHLEQLVSDWSGR